MFKLSNQPVKPAFFLYNNKKIRYNIVGSDTGFPVLLNYGLLGSVHLSNDLINKAKAVNLKLLILERPGYGDSDFIEMHSYAEWADIVATFLDYISESEFGAIGISAGAPYAYALQHQLPEQLTGGLYILSGLPNITDDEIFTLYDEKHKHFYQSIWDEELDNIADVMRSALARYDNFFARLILPKSIKLALDASLSRDGKGLAQTVKLQMHDWGFDVYTIQQTIHLWHAEQDPEITFNAVKKMAEKLPNAHLHIQEASSHFPSKQTLNDLFDKIKATVADDV